MGPHYVALADLELTSASQVLTLQVWATLPGLSVSVRVSLWFLGLFCWSEKVEADNSFR